jgi:hypothetical protein
VSPLREADGTSCVGRAKQCFGRYKLDRRRSVIESLAASRGFRENPQPACQRTLRPEAGLTLAPPVLRKSPRAGLLLRSSPLAAGLGVKFGAAQLV